MLRRVVSLLLLPCLLLTQSAALGHAHCERQTGGRDMRPHVHTSVAPAHNDRGHHHGPGGHHHHHGNHAPVGPETLQARPAEPAPDHDADAVFVAAVDAVAAERSDPAAGPIFSAWWVAGHVSLLDSWDDSSARQASRNRPPRPGGHACPVYVRHLALLI